MEKIKRHLWLENGEPLQQVWLALFYDPFASSEDAGRTPAAPRKVGRREVHPLPIIQEAPLASFLRPLITPRWSGGRGVEAAWFGQQAIIVNHRPMPVVLENLVFTEAIWQYEYDGHTLLPHSAVCLTSAQEQ